MSNIEFDYHKFKRFKAEYLKAKGKESFMFEGREILTSYAKYLIEYLEDKFKGSM